MAKGTFRGLPVYEARIDGEDTGMLRISLVDFPAVESDFLAFAGNTVRQTYSVADEDRRIVRGVVMRADYPIYRADKWGEYWVVYRAGQIRAMAEKYLRDNRQNFVNLMHEAGTDVEGVSLVQWFIKDTAAGIVPAGFDEISDGSLFAEFHIENDEVWAQVRAGVFRGFSLEGIFELTPSEEMFRAQEKDTLKKSNYMSKIQRFKKQLSKLLLAFGNITTDRGVLAWDGEDDLKVGDAAFIEDEAGERTPAEDGEYIADDGRVIVVTGGIVTEIREAETAPEEPEAPMAEEFNSVETDKAVLIYDEDELAEGISVFVETEAGERTPAEDGEYRLADGRVIVVADGRIAEIREAETTETVDTAAEIEALRREVAELRAAVEGIQKLAAAKPAHETVRTAEGYQKTGNRGIDNFARILFAK